MYSEEHDLVSQKKIVAFVSPHGLKNDECYKCSALVSPHGFKNDVYFIVARLFRPSWLNERRL